MGAFGWDPVVYTAENGEMPVIDESLQKDVPAGTTVLKTPIWEPYHIYKRFTGRKKDDKINASFLNENKPEAGTKTPLQVATGLAQKVSVWIRGNFFIPDARKFWIKPSIAYLDQYIKAHQISHVISSGPPHSMHLIALGLKEKNKGLKWIADFRDPWTNIDFYEKLMLTGFADRKHHRQELSVLNAADLVLSIGESMNREFIEIYKNGGGKEIGKFKVITNGFDSDDLVNGGITKDEKFSMAHIGTLVKDRNAPVLWKVLGRLVKNHTGFRESLQIKLVGKVDIYVREQIEQAGLTPYVHDISYLPHDEVIKEQQRSKVLLLLVNQTKNAKGILTGKIFEYMASRVPIIAIGPPDGDLAAILNKTGSGIISDFSDEASLEKNILFYFENNLPAIKEIEVDKYSRKELTRQLCEMLSEL